MWLIFTFWVFYLIVVQNWIPEIRIWTYFLHGWLWFIDLKDPSQVTDALQLTGASLDFGDYGVVGERLFPCSRLNHSHHPERWGDTWPVHQKDKDKDKDKEIELVLGRQQKTHSCQPKKLQSNWWRASPNCSQNCLLCKSQFFWANKTKTARSW